MYYKVVRDIATTSGETFIAGTLLKTITQYVDRRGRTVNREALVTFKNLYVCEIGSIYQMEYTEPIDLHGLNETY